MDHYRLGTHNRPVTAASPDAQTWFDRGLIWLYGYNHEAAIACFERALAADPDCAMAHWGIAYAVGPNYNKPWATFEPEERVASVQRAHASLKAALALADRQTQADRAQIEALKKRCPRNTPTARLRRRSRAA
jgi:tetratricopeptide (TPR) repeat protein